MILELEGPDFLGEVGCFEVRPFLCYRFGMMPDAVKMKLAVQKLAEENGLSLVLLFGSRATGKTHKESDVDIGYLPEQPLSIKDEIHLNYELTLIFGTDHVDTVNLRHASALLLREITDQAVVLFEKTGTELDTFAIYALRRFREASPLFEIRREKLDAFLKPV